MSGPSSLSILLSLTTLISIVSSTTNNGSSRRVLHQPLFPTSSSPPPPAAIPDTQNPDQPFFPEVPIGGGTLNPTTNQPQTQSPPSTNNNISSTPTSQVSSKSTKTVTIAISVGLVTMGMLSALAFFFYRHRKRTNGSEDKGNSERLMRRTNESSSSVAIVAAPSDLLYLGTMEPAVSGSSPYHNNNRLSSPRRMPEMYRPSPELQPLAPLTRGRQREVVISYGTSPSAMSSEDAFYSPQGSNGESPYGANNTTNAATTVKEVILSNNSIPRSRRTSPKARLSTGTSPKSRLSNSNSDVKETIIVSALTPQAPPPPPPPPPLRLSLRQPHGIGPQYNQQPKTPSPPKRKANFSSPPTPPSNLVTKIVNPPPPPPPPMPTTLGKDIPSGITVSLVPKVATWAKTPMPVVEDTQGDNSIGVSKEVEDGDGERPRLRPLHWDKVRATSDRATVWDQLKSSSFQLNEDMIETLFGCNSANSVKKDSSRRSVLPPVELENKVLDPKKSQNIAILLRALNVTRDEVSEALISGNPEDLGADLLETLVKMAPTKEEELKLRDYNGDLSKLGSAERFLKGILDVPFAFKRVDAMLYRANFDTEVNYLRNSFETLEVASEELKNSRLFLKLLEAVLRTGNRMNVGTNRGDARAFKLDTLLKLVDVKGIDGKTTLLHFVVQEMTRTESADTDPTPESPLNKKDQKGLKKQELQVVAGLSRELGNVKKAAGMDSDVLSSYVSKLEMGLEKVRSVAQLEKSNTTENFFGTMQKFLQDAAEEIFRIKAYEKKALFHVKEVTGYFHGDTTKEEAHPLRIFMVVRDFLSVLDQVCKEVGKVHEKTMVGAARSFRITTGASLPVLNRYKIRHEGSSDEDSLSS
ncbi:hypothetical protein GIB67_010770 [Kingdonia uniflora]|uniref:Formin-like protein n=1 Tax=Kingdonia uniflora TaxID=39325 RepID=A0A7J7L914_9MAGN|nr:hypothetical protein GIB67_010770 [Kingdonia uniflora]